MSHGADPNERNSSIWMGDGVRLRAVEPEDWQAFHAWDLDDASSRDAYEVPFPQSAAASRKWAEEQATADPGNDRFRWVIEDQEGEAVGTINTHTCDRRHGTFSYGIFVAAPYRGQGHAEAAIRLVLRYFFQELGYQKVNAHVYAFNHASAALHERLGFALEGRLRRNLFTEGRHHDVLAYGLLAEEFAAGHSAPDATSSENHDLFEVSG